MIMWQVQELLSACSAWALSAKLEFRNVRAQEPPSEEESGSQNYIVTISIHLYAVPGLLATDLIILCLDQVTRTTSDLTPHQREDFETKDVTFISHSIR
ncbi:hypothetical protein TNCV_3348521 [Trichonephila clavipes]|nr:hypothetical protein TNCV_3348521 [Trichonephila clavipes]